MPRPSSAADSKVERLFDRSRPLTTTAWTPPSVGFYLYYPSRRQVPTALKAFVDFVKAHSRATGAPAASVATYDLPSVPAYLICSLSSAALAPS